MKSMHRILSGLLVTAAMIPAASYAQVRPPSSTQPGQVQQHLQIDQARPEVGGAPLITVPGEEGHHKILKGEVTFVLKDVQFENLTVFTKEQLKKDYAEYLGKEASLSTLNEIAFKITARYRNAGYILSRAVVPPQSVSGGVAKIRIVEGYVNKVSFEGGHTDSGLLAEYAAKIRNAKPLDAKTLERYLLLMEDLPGVTAHAVIRPAAGAPGASDVVVQIDEQKISGDVSLDNRGTRYMGPVEGGITVSANNMLGRYDRTQFHGVETAEANELRYGQIIHEEQLDSEGTKLALAGGYTRTHPVFTLAPFDIEGSDTLFSATVSHPFIRSRQSNLYGNIEFDVHNTNVSTLGSGLYSDRLRVLRASSSYDFTDGWLGINKMQGIVSQGLSWDANDASTSSRFGGRTDFLKGNATISRLQPITGPFDLYVAGNGQISANGLLTGEQFGLGGSEFNSAYDPSEVTGDSGAAGRLELRYNRSGDFALVPTYQFYSFYDIGKVWNRDVLAGQYASVSLADAGLGLRFNASSPLSGGVEFAAPLTRGVTTNGQEPDRARVFFNLAYHY